MSSRAEGKRVAERLSIDKEGVFRHEGVEITHPGTLELFFRNLQCDGSGYVVSVGDEWARVDVEDTPFVVKAIREGTDSLQAILNDGTQERVDPETLEIGMGNVLYCRVKAGRFPARFTRQAYYQIAAYIEPTEHEGFCLALPEGRFHIGQRVGTRTD